MKYPLFLSDFDGTLVRADGTISRKNIEWVERYRRHGGTFVVVTGRMLSSILPRLRELGLKEGLVAAYQGATIAEIGTGKLIKDDCLPREMALRAVRILERDDRHIHVYTVEKLYANRRDSGLDAYEKICGVKAEVVSEKLSEKIVREDLRVVKVLAMVEREDRLFVRDRLAEELGEDYFVTCSSDFLVEIMTKDVNKGAAVRRLADHYGFKKEQVAAIGDQLNDLPMLLAAGGRFAVESGEEELKKVACVVPSCEEDGVAYAIEHYAMGDET